MAERLAYLIERLQWHLLAVWFVAMAAADLASLSLPGQRSGGGRYVPGSQSQMAASALQSGFASRSASNVVLVVRDDRYTAGRAGNTASVAAGIARSAPLISGAALLMIAVFGAFAFTGIMPIRDLGFGLAIAIVLDATVIGLVVIPSARKLAGEWNWWLPGRRAPVHAISQPAAERR
jgi:uncharacterized membrane protein YdfJ with MMPL/SSD domain